MKRSTIVTLAIALAGLSGVFGFGIANATGVKSGYPSGTAWQKAAAADSVDSLTGSVKSLGSVRATSTHIDPIGVRGLRVWGNDRFETAVAISEAAWDATSATVVFLATGLNYPDALAGGASTLLAGPLLLVTKDTLPQVTANEISRLQPCLVVGLGGAGAISDQVLAQAEALTTPC